MVNLVRLKDVPLFVVRTQCRLCRAPLTDALLDMGWHYITDFLYREAVPAVPYKAPLVLMRCGACGLVQLKNTVRPEYIYGGGSQYFYLSGTSRTMRVMLEGLALQMGPFLAEGDMVVDIGSNDGTLLGAYARANLIRVGVEPGTGLVARAQARVPNARYINELFSARSFREVFPTQKAKIVTAIAMFYDVDDPAGFLRDVREILADDGRFVLQMNDLYSVVETGSYDIIGHEHLTYWPLRTLVEALARAGMEVLSMERLAINGGTLRLICRALPSEVAASMPESVAAALGAEEALLTVDRLHRFGEDVRRRADALRSWVLEEIRTHGRRVYVYGASTRGNTILQAAGLDYQHIRGAADVHPDKIGRVMVGTGIPIVTEEEARRQASAFIVLPYSYIQEFLAREADFLRAGGKFVVPLPEVRVYTKEDL